jgi:hypothetical protein
VHASAAAVAYTKLQASHDGERRSYFLFRALFVCLLPIFIGD